MDLKLNRLNIFIIITVFWAVIYLVNLGSLELEGEEPRRAMPAVEMLKTGDYLVPSIGGEDYHKKPPGINWLVALSYKITGVINEWSARIVSPVFILLFCTMVIFLPGNWLSGEARFISCVIFITNIAMIQKGRTIEIEPVYVCLTGAAVWWLNCRYNGFSSWLAWLVSAIILGFGMLVKGPFIMFFFYCIAGGVLLYQKRLREFFFPAHIVSFLLMFGIFSAWYLPASACTQSEEMSAEMLNQFLMRFGLELGLSYWAQNVAAAFLNFLPWLLFVPAMWDKRLLSKIPLDKMSFFKGARLGVIAGFIAVNLMPLTQSRYSLPVFAPLSVLLGWVIAQHKQFFPSDRVWKHAVLVGLAAGLVCAGSGLFYTGVDFAGLIVLAVCFVVFITVLICRNRINNVPSLVFATALLISVLALQYAVFVTKVRNKQAVARSAAQQINSIVPEKKILYAYKPELQIFLFYVSRDIGYILSEEEFGKNVEYMIIEYEKYKRLSETRGDITADTEVLFEFDDRTNERQLLLKFQKGK